MMKHFATIFSVFFLFAVTVSAKPGPDGGASVAADAPASQPAVSQPVAASAASVPAASVSSMQAYACVEDDGLITAVVNDASYSCPQGSKLVKFDRTVAEASGTAQAAREKEQQAAKQAAAPSPVSASAPAPQAKQAAASTPAPAVPSPTPTQAEEQQVKPDCQSSKQEACPVKTAPLSKEALARAKANAEAIRAAQRRCGITVDGIMGPRTRKCLRQLATTEEEASAPTPSSPSPTPPASSEETAADNASGSSREQETATLAVYWCEHGPTTGGVEWRERPFICATDTAAELRHLPRGENCPPSLKLLQVSFTGGRFQACPATAVAGGTLLTRETPSEPLYKKWWFWTAIGVAIAGGAAAAAYYGSQPDVKNYYGQGQQGLRF